MQAGGQLIQGQAQAGSDNANSAILARQARLTQQQGFIDADAARRRSNQVIGEQAAQISESGTGTDGSNADIARQSAVNAHLDAMNIQYAGVLRGSGLMAQSAAYKASAKQASIGSIFMAGSSLLSGRAAQKKADYNASPAVN